MKSSYLATLPATSTLVAGCLLLACCALFISLGVWQLSRADEKRAIEAKLQASLTKAAESWHAGTQAFTRVRAKGRFDNAHIFLIDNRTHLGEPGVQVVQAFETEEGQRLLVDRGWMPYPNRQSLPQPATPVGQIEIIGLVLPDFGVGPRLGDERDTRSDDQPRLLQQLDLERMGVLAGAKQTSILRLRSGEPGALITRPFELPMGAQRHTGYAVQWFGLALASILLTLILVRGMFIRGTNNRAKPHG